MQYETVSHEKPVGVSEGYTTWQHPYRDTQIYVHPEVVRTLSAEALRASKEEGEIGGALWGKAGSDDSIIIMDATLAPNSGLLFNTTATDAREIAQILNGRGPQASLSLAGYFRSYIREGLCLTEQDQTVIHQNLRDPDAVFLVIKPFAIGVCTAGLFFWQDGRLQTESSDLEVPFIAFDESWRKDPAATHEPAAPRRPVSLPEAARPQRERPLPNQFDAHPTPSAIPPQPKYFDEYPTPSKPPAQAKASASDPLPNRPPALDESAEPQLMAMLRESAMRNPSSQSSARRSVESAPQAPKPAATTPARALLVLAFVCSFGILAGIGLYLLIPMLRGAFQGPPEHPPNAHIDLQVTHSDGGQLDLNWDRTAPDVTRAGSATLLITDGRATHKLKLDNEQLRSGKLMYFAKSDDVQFRLELNTDSMHTVAESVRVLLPTVETRRTKRQSPAASERDEPPARTTLGSEDAVAGAARSRTSNSNSRDDAGGSFSGRPRERSGVQARALPARSPLPVMPSMVTATSGVLPAQVTPAGTFIPPQVVEETMPDTAPLGQFAQVSVEVGIDQTGRVTAAHPIEDGGVSDPALMAVATAAAARWRFSPATLNGRPVAADYRIVFAFHSQLRR